MKTYKDDEIYDIIDQVSALYDTIYCDEIEEPHFLKKRMENSLAAQLHPIIVTEECEDRLVGFLCGFDFKESNWWAQQVDKVLPKQIEWYHNSFEINELCVAESYRRKGIGYQLMNVLSTTDFDYSLLSVRSDNAPALALYKKLNYQLLHADFCFEGGHILYHILYKEHSST
ncbi:N-acetyltransferase family protein [Streptococcus sp. ZJ93]|uniref:GNAT family N-acetyltransferase n=1 Tax=Streptococcus handemini TaxID=3161188 RepID=UPI0032EE2537